MSKLCALCNKKISQSFPLSYEMRNFQICNSCHSVLNLVRKAQELSPDDQGKNLAYIRDNWVNISDPEVKKYADNISDKFLFQCKNAIPALEERDKINELKKGIIITTAPSIDGYRIIEHCGLVFGETVFKASLSDSIIKGLEDSFNSLNFSSTEMTGIVSLLEQARDYSMYKMIEKAVRLHCNAIIAVDSESSEFVGGIHVTIYGTAVKMEKIS